MKSLKTAVIAGGILNLLFALFHVLLCKWIYTGSHGAPYYPLMQMFAICGCIMIWFLALTSLVYREQLAASPVGRSILLLNVAIYGTRIAGEIILFPQHQPLIIGVCAIMTALYGWIFFQARKSTAS
jgi:hypothetical protein